MKRLTLLLVWAWVSLPLGWGVYQSVKKSLPLFRSPMAPPAAEKAVAH